MCTWSDARIGSKFYPLEVLFSPNDLNVSAMDSEKF